MSIIRAGSIRWFDVKSFPAAHSFLVWMMKNEGYHAEELAGHSNLQKAAGKDLPVTWDSKKSIGGSWVKFNLQKATCVNMEEDKQMVGGNYLVQSHGQNCISAGPIGLREACGQRGGEERVIYGPDLHSVEFAVC